MRLRKAVARLALTPGSRAVASTRGSAFSRGVALFFLFSRATRKVISFQSVVFKGALHRVIDKITVRAFVMRRTDTRSIRDGRSVVFEVRFKRTDR